MAEAKVACDHCEATGVETFKLTGDPAAGCAHTKHPSRFSATTAASRESTGTCGSVPVLPYPSSRVTLTRSTLTVLVLPSAAGQILNALTNSLSCSAMVATF